MSEDFVRAIRTADVAAGGLIAVELNGHQLVICNCDGSFYAVERRCGHMNAPLEMGTLDGTVLTCPLHYAQFDVTTGEALSGPVPAYPGPKTPAPRTGAYFKGLVMRHIGTESISAYRTEVESGWVWVALPAP